MAYQDYRALIVWKEAHALALDVYLSTASFPSHEKFGLTSQIRRSAVSIPANIVEGNAKTSMKEQLRYCEIARGSLAECGYLLELARDLKYLVSNDHDRLEDRVKRVEYLLLKLMTSKGKDLRTLYSS